MLGLSQGAHADLSALHLVKSRDLPHPVCSDRSGDIQLQFYMCLCNVGCLSKICIVRALVHVAEFHCLGYLIHYVVGRGNLMYVPAPSVLHDLGRVRAAFGLMSCPILDNTVALFVCCLVDIANVTFRSSRLKLCGLEASFT